jgi:hypothetical protein
MKSDIYITFAIKANMKITAEMTFETLKRAATSSYIRKLDERVTFGPFLFSSPCRSNRATTEPTTKQSPDVMNMTNEMDTIFVSICVSKLYQEKR